MIVVKIAAGGDCGGDDFWFQHFILMKGESIEIYIINTLGGEGGEE